MSDKVKVEAELVWVREGEKIPDGMYVEAEDARLKIGHACCESRWTIKLPDNFKAPEPPPKTREVPFSEAADHMAFGGEARPKSYRDGRWFRICGDVFVDENGLRAAHWICVVNEPWIIKEKA